MIIRAGPGQRDPSKLRFNSIPSPGALQPGRYQVPGTIATMLICRAPEIG